MDKRGAPHRGAYRDRESEAFFFLEVREGEFRDFSGFAALNMERVSVYGFLIGLVCEERLGYRAKLE